MKNEGYIKNVDQLIAETSLDDVLVHFGQAPCNLQSGEYRMNCVFSSECQTSSYGNLAVNVSHPAKQVFCHVCGTRGNLLTLIHGLETQTPPASGKLRGQEFKNALRKLREIRGIVAAAQESKANASLASPEAKTESSSPLRNVPLHRHDNEAARKVADLFNDLIVDSEAMSPASAAYVRNRPWMTPDVMKKWGVGYLPRDGRSMFRGLFVYTHRNQQGQPLSYSARDPLFEEKHQAWLRQGNPDAPRKPIKHKYVKGFQRGLELFGQQTSRLEETHVQESLDDHGLVVVEGPNDVIRLDALGVAAVGVCSNRATEAQVKRIERFANSAAGGRVMLMPDNDEEGESGFKELLWTLLSMRLEARLGWSRTLAGGHYDGMQPEQISVEQWHSIANG